MMSIQEQAVQMINCLSEDNIIFLMDFMKRFMLPENKQEELIKERKSSADNYGVRYHKGIWKCLF